MKTWSRFRFKKQHDSKVLNFLDLWQNLYIIFVYYAYGCIGKKAVYYRDLFNNNRLETSWFIKTLFGFLHQILWRWNNWYCTAPTHNIYDQITWYTCPTFNLSRELLRIVYYKYTMSRYPFRAIVKRFLGLCFNRKKVFCYFKNMTGCICLDLPTASNFSISF